MDLDSYQWMGLERNLVLVCYSLTFSAYPCLFCTDFAGWQMVPWALAAATTGYAIYLTYKNCKSDSDPGCCHVNKSVDKDNPKVVHTQDVEDLGPRTCYCRCWLSKKFPYCDGIFLFKNLKNNQVLISPFLYSFKVPTTNTTKRPETTWARWCCSVNRLAPHVVITCRAFSHLLALNTMFFPTKNL